MINLTSIIRLTVIGILLLTVPVFAQVEDDELEMLGEERPCVPESLTVAYDKYQSAEVQLNDIRQWYSFGSEYFKNKDYKSALPYLWKVFVNDSTKYARNAIRKIADCYFNLQMADSTLIASYRGLQKFSDQIRLHYYAGFLQDKLGKSECAIPHYEALVKDQPTNETYLEKLAFLYFKQDDEKALEYQKKLVDLNPNNSYYQNTLAQYGEHFYGAGGGLQAYADAWKNDPENPEFAFKYGKAAYDAGEYLAALKPLNTVIKKDGKNAKAYEIRALTLESLEKYSAAIADYKKVLELEPKNVNIMCALANDYRNLNQFSKAKYWVRKALKTKPGFGLAYITMGEIYESAVLYCQRNRSRKYDDGLVYELALKEYRKATKDPSFKSMALKRIRSVKPFLPTKEEVFMNQSRKNIKLKCYSWIK